MFRRGGRASTSDGRRLIWSAAEGSRGTRWREAVVVGDPDEAAVVAAADGSSRTTAGMVRSVLLEVSNGGRVAKVEVATGAGLLTLHPETDESMLHGNVVTPDGVRHLAFEWSPRHELIVEGSPASLSVIAARMGPALEPGGTLEVAAVAVGDALDPRPGIWVIKRLTQTRWLFRSDSGATDELATDAAGHPAFEGGVDWPLERE
jgi:hypothetical protein